MAAERAEFAAAAEDIEDEDTLPAGSTEPKLEQVTLPPPPKADDGAANPPAKTETATPKVEPTPPPVVRPREVEPAKKKGKKCDGEP